MPLLSIIIPVYNVEKYLDECLESIRQQAFSDYEVIMVDDGSRDSSADICRIFAETDGRFIFIHKENGGVSSARNAGLEATRGEWISFVDADDIVTSNYLTAFFGSKPLADITFFGMKTMETDGSSKERIPQEAFANRREAAEDVMYRLKCGDPSDMLGYTWNKFFRASIIKKYRLRFVEGLRYREDEIFTLEYCRHISSVRVIEQPLYLYRIVESGLTNRGPGLADLMHLSLHLVENLRFYSNPALCETLLKNATDYRALHIYKSPLSQLSALLRDYQTMVSEHPQPGNIYRANTLSRYLRKGYWAAYLYCLLRKGVGR